MRKEIYICGFGGFSREVYWYAKELQNNLEVKVMGFVDKFPEGLTCKLRNYYDGIPIFNENVFDYNEKSVVIATGYPELRRKIYNNIINKFSNVDFPNIISPRANIMAKQTLTLGKGIIITAGCSITCDIVLDDFINLNMNTTVGHDTIMKKFVTTATNVSISGHVTLGENVYLGNNSCVREKCVICDDVIIGMGCTVVKNIVESGTYVGVPSRRIK